MGSSLSALQVQHRNELQYLLRKAQHDCPARELTLLLQEVRAKCPWYPEAGSLKLADWERLGQTLHKEPRAPVQALHAWHLCRDVVQRVASDRPSLARLVLSPPPSAPAVIPPPGDATQRVALERPSSAPTEELPILPPPSAPAAIPPPASPPVPLLPPPPWPSPPEPVCDYPPPMGPPGESSASAQKLSLVQQMVHAAKARSDLTAEELADLVSVCPVTWQNDDQGNPVGTWTTLPYSVVREVKKAIREFGLTSTFVRGLIEGMGAGYSLIPEDWKTLLRMMLSPSQYVIWLSEYRQMAERQAQVYREQGIIYEHLAGEGQFATIGMQSQLPPAVFPIISTFCARWDVRLKHGIPYNSTGQAIVERANRTLKTLLDKQLKQGELHLRTLGDIQQQMYILLFTLNNLTLNADQQTPADRHFHKSEVLERPRVFYRQLPDPQWLGPAPLITWGRGYAAVSLPAGPLWVPARCVRPALKQHGMAPGAVESHTRVSADLGGDRVAPRVDNGGTETEEA
ncbi:unnamed protein product [Lepidochelys olivacea]